MKSQNERIKEVERRMDVLSKQFDRLLNLTTQIADNFIELAVTLNVPYKKETNKKQMKRRKK